VSHLRPCTQAKIFPFWDVDGEECEDNEVGLDRCILREVAMLRLLNGGHPNLMRISDISADIDGHLGFVMAKAAGTLRGAIESGSLTNKEKVRIAALVLHALSYMHSFDIIHRDIKPDNLLLTPDREPVLADLSLARFVSVGATADAEKEAAGGGKAARRKRKRKQQQAAGEEAVGLSEFMGTPCYTAPEIVDGGVEYDCKADVFSLGIVLFELFDGKLLDAGASSTRAVPGAAACRAPAHAPAPRAPLITAPAAQARTSAPSQWSSRSAPS
jgi:serine/threonine protein kinase